MLLKFSKLIIELAFFDIRLIIRGYMDKNYTYEIEEFFRDNNIKTILINYITYIDQTIHALKRLKRDFGKKSVVDNEIKDNNQVTHSKNFPNEVSTKGDLVQDSSIKI